MYIHGASSTSTRPRSDKSPLPKSNGEPRISKVNCGMEKPISKLVDPKKEEEKYKKAYSSSNIVYADLEILKKYNTPLNVQALMTLIKDEISIDPSKMLFKLITASRKESNIDIADICVSLIFIKALLLYINDTYTNYTTCTLEIIHDTLSTIVPLSHDKSSDVAKLLNVLFSNVGHFSTKDPMIKYLSEIIKKLNKETEKKKDKKATYQTLDLIALYRLMKDNGSLTATYYITIVEELKNAQEQEVTSSEESEIRQKEIRNQLAQQFDQDYKILREKMREHVFFTSEGLMDKENYIAYLQSPSNTNNKELSKQLKKQQQSLEKQLEENRKKQEKLTLTKPTKSSNNNTEKFNQEDTENQDAYTAEKMVLEQQNTELLEQVIQSLGKLSQQVNIFEDKLENNKNHMKEFVEQHMQSSPAPTKTAVQKELNEFQSTFGITKNTNTSPTIDERKLATEIAKNLNQNQNKPQIDQQKLDASIQSSVHKAIEEKTKSLTTNQPIDNQALKDINRTQLEFRDVLSNVQSHINNQLKKINELQQSINAIDSKNENNGDKNNTDHEYNIQLQQYNEELKKLHQLNNVTVEHLKSMETVINENLTPVKNSKFKDPLIIGAAGTTGLVAGKAFFNNNASNITNDLAPNDTEPSHIPTEQQVDLT